MGARDADAVGVPAVPVSHRVRVPRRAAHRVRGEREGVFGHLDTEGSRSFGLEGVSRTESSAWLCRRPCPEIVLSLTRAISWA